jgi:hypothetical protein
MRPAPFLLLLAVGVQALAYENAPEAATQPSNMPAEDGPSVTPYRPSVSTPASLSAPGYLEYEFGALAARSAAPVRRNSLPYDLKVAFNPDWGVRASGEAWVEQGDAYGRRLQGLGDGSLVLKHRFCVGESSAFGWELGATMATGRDGISSGTSAYSLNGIYSADMGPWHADLNLLVSRAGNADPGVSRNQWIWASALSRPLMGAWGLTGELSGTRQIGAPETRQFLLATTYGLGRTVVLDIGFSRSLRPGVNDAAAFAGITLLGPRLF